MRSRTFLVGVLLAAIVASGAAAFNFVRTESGPAPDIAFLDADGNEVSLEDFRGKIVVLNLWATWCAPCRREMPSLDRLQAAHGGDDLQVVPLSVDRGDSTEKIKQFYAEVGVTHLPIYRDPQAEATRTLRAPGLPTTVVFDRDGREVGRVLGPDEWDGGEALDLLRSFMAG